MSIRIQKNRKHSASIMALILAAPIYLGLILSQSLTNFQAIIGISVGALIIGIRSIVVEVGVRRAASQFENSLEKSAQRQLRKKLGVEIREISEL